MASGQKSSIESLRRRRSRMTEEDKEIKRQKCRLYWKKNKEKRTERSKMIYRIAKEYADKHKC